MKRQAEAGVHMGWPYSAVGMQRALEAAIGLPSRPTSASQMLVFVTPPDVRRSFKMPSDSSVIDWLTYRLGTIARLMAAARTKTLSATNGLRALDLSRGSSAV